MIIKTVIDTFGTRYSDRIALQEVVGFEKRLCKWTYSEFYNDILRVAAYFMQNQLNGRMIGVLAPNSYQWLVYTYAGFYVGSTMVLMHSDISDDKAKESITRADVEVLISDRQLDIDIPVIAIYDDLPDCTYDGDYPIINEADRACIIFTSGTTGLEKMVQLSNENIVGMLEWVGEYIPEMQFVDFNVFPFSHTSSFSLLILLYNGSVVCFQKKPKYFFRDLKIFEPHIIAMVPSYLEAISNKAKLGTPIREIVGNRCFTISCGGAILDEELVAEMAEQNIQCTNGYGLTESCGNGCMQKTGIDAKPGSLGKPNTELKIESGEILLRGQGIMMGYYKDEEATQSAIVDGWLHTGDLGYMDEEGYVYLTGRKKNLIILSNGKNISPEEIEKEIMCCPYIKEIIVKGEDNYLAAIIYAEDMDRELIEAYIKEYNGRSESYKRIHKTYYSEIELAKTVSGKLKRDIY